MIVVTSEAFQFGLGAFETLRTYNKIVFKPDEHIERLFKSAKQIGLQTSIARKNIFSDLQKIIEKSPDTEQRIKIILASEGIIITSEKLIIPKDIKLGISLKSIIQRRAFPGAKTLSYLDSFVSHTSAAAAGDYDALLLDENKEVYEGAYSNIFWFEGDVLCTRKDNVLGGVTAQTILELSPFQTQFKTVSLGNLLKKGEIFLTQTSAGILPVTRIDKHIINNGKVGERTKKLIQMFLEYVKKYK